MKTRESLSERLHTLCKNVYYQPTENTKMSYPCLIYTFEGLRDIKADNGNYVTYDRYTITNVYKSPSSALLTSLREMFPFHFSFDRRYISDGLYHDVYDLYW